MKEQYTSPELNLVSFVSKDRLSTNINFNDFFSNGLSLGSVDPASEHNGDFKESI